MSDVRCQMSDVRCEPARKEKVCITNVCTCLGAFAAAGIMGALREMWGKKRRNASGWCVIGTSRATTRGWLGAARGQSIKDETLQAGLTGWPPCLHGQSGNPSANALPGKSLGRIQS